MQHYLLYRAYGDLHYIDECRYSLLKYLSVYNLKPPANITVVVYTDKPALFEAFEPFFHYFEIKEMPAKALRKNSDSAKIDFIKDFVLEHNGNTIYCNSDTYFTQPVTEAFEGIEKGNFYFFGKEKASARIKEYLVQNPIRIKGQPISYPDSAHFFSTEMVGINNKAAGFLPDASLLYANLHKQFGRRLAEQFALNYYLKNASVETLQGKAFSYHNLSEFKTLLQLFFKKNEEESIPNLIKLTHHLDAATIKKDRDRYIGLPFYKKLLRSLTGKRWSIRQYQNKL